MLPPRLPGNPPRVPTGYRSRLQERLPAVAESVAAMRHAVVACAEESGASARQCEDIALAVSEAVGNAAVHAYPEGRPGDVTLVAWADERLLHVVVSDDGVGIHPRIDSPGLKLGLAIIGQMAEQLTLESRQATPGLRVHMTFAID